MTISAVAGGGRGAIVGEIFWGLPVDSIMFSDNNVLPVSTA